MADAYWARYGGCPTCDAPPSTPCRKMQWIDGDLYTTLEPAEWMDWAHTARPFQDIPTTAANLLDDVVSVSVREGVAVGPGDVLVIRLDPPEKLDDFETFAGELERMRAHIQSQLPRGSRCLVVAGAGNLAVVRGEEAADSADGATVGTQPACREGGPGVVGRVEPPATTTGGPDVDPQPRPRCGA